MDYLSVLRKVFPSGNEYVVHIYEEFGGVFVCEMLEHMIHCAGEGCRGVGEAEEHHVWLKQAKGCFKRGHPLVLFSDANVVVSPVDVKLSEDFLSLQLFEYGADEGEWVGVSYCPRVEWSIVHDWAEFSILFLSEEEG